MNEPHYVILDTHDIVGALYQELDRVGAHTFDIDELCGHILEQLPQYMIEERNALSLVEPFIDELTEIIDNDKLGTEAMHAIVWQVRGFAKLLYHKFQECGLYCRDTTTGQGVLCYQFHGLAGFNIIMERNLV